MGIFNCDWFSFTADFANYDTTTNEHLKKLFNQLEKEREKEQSGFIDLALFSFEVYNHGSRTYYYILHNDDLQIKLARYRSRNKDTYPIFIHFKSHFLWSDLYGLKTLEQKLKFVIEWLEDCLGCKYITSKINRLDLCYHTDKVPELSADNFVGKHTTDNTYRTHRVVSGIEIGSRKTQKVFLRCYNKYLETRSKKKEWFFDIWLQNGLNIRKVWNIEFEMNRDFFTETKIGGKKIDTAEQAVQAFKPLWHYLTTKWITYRIPSGERRTRWEIDDFWRQLQIFKECEKLTREKQIESPTLSSIAPGLIGYLSSFAARKDGQLEDGSLFKEFYDLLQEYEEKYKKDFGEMVQKKKKLLAND